MAKRVVFLHGSPGRATLWEPLIALAPTGTECVAFDLLGHGDAADAGEDPDDIVRDVVDRVRSLGGPVTLVGHSFGAWVAGRAIPALDGAVERFVAIAGIPGMDEAIAGRLLGFAGALDGGLLTMEAAAAVGVDLWLPTQARDPRDVERLTSVFTSERADRLARALRRTARLAEPSRWVVRHDVPTTSIHCTGDRAAPVELGRKLSELSSSGDWIEIDSDGHYPQWSHVELVAQAVFEG
jgi:pimeloyl-ACP methyl ester carboxylesterase